MIFSRIVKMCSMYWVVAGVAMVMATHIVSAQSEYEDTEFGEFLYNEASIKTRDEMVNLLTNGASPEMVFLQAISMGLGIDEVLDAAIRLDQSRGREFVTSAAALLPYVSDVKREAQSSYQLDDLEQPYSVQTVIERFFENRQILEPYPDWLQQQNHFDVPAVELQRMVDNNKNMKWFRNNSNNTTTDRPVFIALYPANKSVLIDSEQRIEQALSNDKEATLPVVFIFNSLTERAVDQLDYPKTIRDIQKAYLENSLMVTPAPEWQRGEYHIIASIDEIKDIFDIPVESDFEPETWENLLQEAALPVEDTSFLMVMLPSSGGNKLVGNQRDQKTLQTIMGEGLVLNRADKIAALDSLGVKSVPLVFYYINNNRVKPYKKGVGGLKQVAVGAGLSLSSLGISAGYVPSSMSGGGGFAPPPSVVVPPEPPVPPILPPEPPECPSPPCRS